MSKETDLECWASALKRRERYAHLVWIRWKKHKDSELRLKRYVDAIKLCEEAQTKVRALC